jgi:hypothetical protein
MSPTKDGPRRTCTNRHHLRHPIGLHQLPACVRMGKSEVNELARKFEEREETANKQQATLQMHVGAHTEEDEDSGEVSEDIHSHSDAEGDVGAC